MSTSKPNYVYVASSWRNPIYPAVIETFKAAGIPHYDFRNPDGGTGFTWDEVGGLPDEAVIPPKTYTEMIEHPRAIAGYEADYAAMEKADTFVLVLPCGKSAHLELGWSVGAGKRTAILLEDPMQPELMYRMVDHLAPSLFDLLGWLGANVADEYGPDRFMPREVDGEGIADVVWMDAPDDADYSEGIPVTRMRAFTEEALRQHDAEVAAKALGALASRAQMNASTTIDLAGGHVTPNGKAKVVAWMAMADMATDEAERIRREAGLS